jgi:hypothetical protein
VEDGAALVGDATERDDLDTFDGALAADDARAVGETGRGLGCRGRLFGLRHEAFT